MVLTSHVYEAMKMCLTLTNLFGHKHVKYGCFRCYITKLRNVKSGYIVHSKVQSSLKEHGHDGNYNWYFSLNRKGKPLMDPYSIFSFAFAAIFFGQLNLATGNEEYAGYKTDHPITC